MAERAVSEREEEAEAGEAGEEVKVVWKSKAEVLKQFDLPPGFFYSKEEPMSLKPFEYLVTLKESTTATAILKPAILGPVEVVLAESAEQAKLKAAQKCERPVEEVDIFVRPFCSG